MSQGPVLIELDEKQTPASVADAPPVPDNDVPAGQGDAMQLAAGWATKSPSRLARWFFGLGAMLVGAFVSVAAWDFAIGLLSRNTVLGWAFAALLAAFLCVTCAIGLRELAAFARLSDISAVRRSADALQPGGDLADARAVSARLVKLYRHREETRWGRDRLAELAPDQLDTESLMSLTEIELLTPLDALATRQIERAARQVATVTALVPLALADVVSALVANIRMIRRIAEIYGGRSGTIGSWQLTRAVFAHMVATGAVAVGDDLLEPVLGGSILGKVSRRFGEGLVNGALTARVGVASMDVCRPMAFGPGRQPKVRDIIKNSLTGFVTGEK